MSKSCNFAALNFLPGGSLHRAIHAGAPLVFGSLGVGSDQLTRPWKSNKDSVLGRIHGARIADPIKENLQRYCWATWLWEQSV